MKTTNILSVLFLAILPFGSAFGGNLDIPTSNLDGLLNDYGQSYTKLNNYLKQIEASGPKCEKTYFGHHVGDEVAAKVAEARTALADHIKRVSASTRAVKDRIAQVEQKFSASGTTIGTGGVLALQNGIVVPVSESVKQAKITLNAEKVKLGNTTREIDRNDGSIRAGLNDPGSKACMAALKAYEQGFDLYGKLPAKIDAINRALDGQVAIAKAQVDAIATLEGSVAQIR